MTRVLSIHADYGCRNTGVCCSSGWDVPVEPHVEEGLRRALDEGALRASEGAPPFRRVSGLPHGARVVFRSDGQGRCVFLEAGARPLCAVHRQLGPGHLASACRDFPRVVLLSPLSTSITLSHYCPTAAALLFRQPCDLAVVEDPPAFPKTWPYEGLDARESFSPLLRPEVLMGWAAYERWEAHSVAVLGAGDRSPEESLALLAAQAEAARRWRSSDGPFDTHLESILDTEPAVDDPTVSPSSDRRAWDFAARCVPASHPCPEPPPEGGAAPQVWGEGATPVRRWLAARAFASWVALQGEGLRSTVSALHLALAVLRAERARAARKGEDALREAIRRADLLLVHLADPQAVARSLSRAEKGSARAAW